MGRSVPAAARRVNGAAARRPGWLPGIQRIIRVDDVIWRPIEAERRHTESGVVVVYPAGRDEEMPQRGFLDMILAAVSRA